MKALVTGSNGFIGSRLVEELVQRGDQVRCLVRKTSNLRWIQDLDVEFIYGELLDESSLVPAVGGADCIFHLAGVTKARDREGYFSGNYQGTVNLLSASKNYGSEDQKFIFVSSLAAAGPAPSCTALKEDDPARPISYYGEAKLAAEKAVLEYADIRPVVVIRPPAVFGPRDADVYEIFRIISKGVKPILGGRNRLASLVHVHDLVRGVILSADYKEANGQIFYICNDSYYDWQIITQEIVKALDKRVITFRVPIVFLDIVSLFSELIANLTSKPALFNQERVKEYKQPYWICDNSKAKEMLGFAPQLSLSEGISNTVAWYRDNGWL